MVAKTSRECGANKWTGKHQNTTSSQKLVRLAVTLSPIVVLAALGAPLLLTLECLLTLRESS